MSQLANILLIDTSRPQVWVAVIEDENVTAEREWLGDRTLGVRLLEVIQELVPTDVDRIAVHAGSGHFMAVRTGVVTAQLLAQAWGAELVGIDGQERSEMIWQAQEKQAVGVVKVSYVKEGISPDKGR